MLTHILIQPDRIKGESQNAISTYTVSSDVWSVGLATIEIALGAYPYPPETYSNVFAQLQVRHVSYQSRRLSLTGCPS